MVFNLKRSYQRPARSQLIVGLFLTIPFCTKGTAQVPSLADCTRARDQYTALNGKLLVAAKGADVLQPDGMKRGTSDLTGFITQVILARLQDSGEPSTIRSYLSCMQEGEYEHASERFTNTPQVEIIKPAQVSVAVSSLLIMRGGSGIPSTRPLIECFAQKGSAWNLVGQSGDEFDGHTFFTYPLHAPNQQESWYLLSGRTIGDTGGRLKLEVVSCSPDHFQKIWERDGFEWGDIQVDGGSVVLNYEKRDERGQIIRTEPNGPEHKRFTEYLRVTNKGLEL